MPGPDSGRTLCNILNYKAVTARTSMYNISAESAYTTLMMSWSKQKLVFASYFFLTERRTMDNIAATHRIITTEVFL